MSFETEKNLNEFWPSGSFSYRETGAESCDVQEPRRLNLYKNIIEERQFTDGYSVVDLGHKTRISVDELNEIESNQSSSITIINLNGLKEISRSVALWLVKDPDRTVYLNGLDHITEDVAEILSVLNILYLNGLKSLSAEEAKCFVMGRVMSIELNGMNEISNDVLSILCGSKLSGIYLNSINTLDLSACKIISGFKGALNLQGIIDMSPQEAKIIGNTKGSLSLGIKNLSPEIADGLAQSSGLHLRLNNLESLDRDTAAAISKYSGKSLMFGQVTQISDEVAAAMESCQAAIFFPKISHISDNAALSLGKLRGGLELGIVEISEESARSLSMVRGPLSFPNLLELSSKSAFFLGNHHGSLFLNKIKYLTDEAAEGLSRHRGELKFGNLENITGLVAKWLASTSGELELGIKNLGKDVAKALVSHSGNIVLKNIERLSDDEVTGLTDFKGCIYMPKLNEISNFGIAQFRLLMRGRIFTDNSDLTNQLSKH